MRVLMIGFLALFAADATAQRHEDTDKLGRALEYFQSAKYHEALLLFDYLDRNYTLNPRFRAYMALCYYYEWDYQKAVDYFAKSLPELEGLAPHERSVYYFAAAESCFNLGKYEESTIYYNKVLQVCYPQEQAAAILLLANGLKPSRILSHPCRYIALSAWLKTSRHGFRSSRE